MAVSKLDEVVSLAKRRGFVFPAGEIYGGTRSAWDYGPLGVALKDNIKREWWRSMVVTRGDVVGVDTSIILPTPVWVASGHVAVFNDPLVECLNCHKRQRSDKLEESYAEKHGDKLPENGMADIVCPDCGTRGKWTEPRDFNMMLRTHLGPVEDENSLHYLRPETAQGIFVDFKNVMTSSRSRPPFGIANMGKSFRNEITPGNFTFRTREFEQMEMQFFVKPGTELEWFPKWKEIRLKWHKALGFGDDHYRFHDHDKLAHYANAATDIEFLMPFGFKEVEGIHSRTNFDLSQHEKFSGKSIKYFDPELNESYTPYVIETSIGVDRMFLSIMSAAYTEETLESGETRVVLKLPAALAPVKLAVMPLVKKDGLPEKAREIMNDLKFHFHCQYDEKDSIGKRYRRQDAIGTPYCITVDHQTLEDNCVTLRNRDTMQQERVAISELNNIIADKVSITSLLKTLQ